MSDEKLEILLDQPEEKSGVTEDPIDAAAEDSAAEVNCNRSTGPRTAHGKRRSSRNAVKHGFFCRDLLMTLSTADRREWSKLLRGLRETWDPIGQNELIQVELMAFHLQQQKRLMRLMSIRRNSTPTFLLDTDRTPTKLKPAVFDQWLHDLPSLDDLEKFQRCEAHNLRHYYRAQGELERLQRMRLGEKVAPRLLVDVNAPGVE